MNADYLQSLCYLDTNLLIYMFDDKDVVKQQKANELYLYFLTTGLGRISVQVMSEWRNAMVKKFAHLVDNAYRREFLETLQAWHPLQISPEIILSADRLCDHYSFSPL
jgi:predicted nucleic acid-binding protein